MVALGVEPRREGPRHGLAGGGTPSRGSEPWSRWGWNPVARVRAMVGLGVEPRREGPRHSAFARAAGAGVAAIGPIEV
jgi:hypothetical protein